MQSFTMESFHAPFFLFALGILLIASYALDMWRSSAKAGAPQILVREYFPGGRIFKFLTNPTHVQDMVSELYSEYGPFFSARLGATPILFTSCPGDILHIAARVEKFAYTPRTLGLVEYAGPGSLFSLSHELHRRARRDIRETFSPRLLHGFWAPFNAAWCATACDLARHLGGVGADGSAYVDASAMFQKIAIRVLLNVAFGAAVSEDEIVSCGKHATKFLHLGINDAMRYPISGSWLGKLFGLRQDIDAELAYLKDICRKLVRDRMNESTTEKSRRAVDLLDALVGLEGSTEESIISNCLFFMVGGSLSPVAALSWAVYYICGDEKVYQNVQNEIDGLNCNQDFKFEHVSQLKYLQHVWKETLRLQPPNNGVLKIAQCDLQLPESNVKVAAGTYVYGLVGAAHRDPRIWKRANEFVPERWDTATGDGPRAPKGAYMPYLAGPRNCPGSFLADFQGVFILAMLFREYEIELAVPREEVVLVSAHGYISAPGTKDPLDPHANVMPGLPLRITKRCQC